MAVKVFLTGATGYIGGDALYHLHGKRPDFEFALLIRSEEKAKKVLASYPKARAVIGGLDDSETIEREAAWADIVIRKYPSLLQNGGANTTRYRRLVRPRWKRECHSQGPHTGAFCLSPWILAAHWWDRHSDLF